MDKKILTIGIIAIILLIGSNLTTFFVTKNKYSVVKPDTIIVKQDTKIDSTYKVKEGSFNIKVPKENVKKIDSSKADSLGYGDAYGGEDYPIIPIDVSKVIDSLNIVISVKSKDIIRDLVTSGLEFIIKVKELTVKETNTIATEKFILKEIEVEKCNFWTGYAWGATTISVILAIILSLVL